MRLESDKIVASHSNIATSEIGDAGSQTHIGDQLVGCTAVYVGCIGASFWLGSYKINISVPISIRSTIRHKISL